MRTVSFDFASHSGLPSDLSEHKSLRSQASLQSSRASLKFCAENVRVGRPSTQRVKALEISTGPRISGLFLAIDTHFAKLFRPFEKSPLSVGRFLGRSRWI